MKFKILSLIVQFIGSFFGSRVSRTLKKDLILFKEGQRKVIMDELRTAEEKGDLELVDHWEQKLVIFLKRNDEYYSEE